MQEILIEENEHDQRLDRFVAKFLDKAPRDFIFRMIRKKNIEVNKKKAQPETILKNGDRVQFFLSDETIDKFRTEIEIEDSNLKLDVIYEDDNIILINKEIGVLSHSSGEGEENIVDSMISYLVDKGDYKPKEEVTFIPSICNRLDRNTAGIIIGAKNYQSLKGINEAIKNRTIRRLYKTIVSGEFREDEIVRDYLYKDSRDNKVYVTKDKEDSSKSIETHFNVLKVKNAYSLLEVELITGRTHQIRGHLKSLNFPIIGDPKYGDREVNQYFKDKYKLNYQWLHGYKVEFNGLEDDLKYLNGKSFISKGSIVFSKIENDIFN